MERVEEAVALAEALLVESRRREGRGSRRRRARLARMLADPRGRAFTVALTDEVVRIRDPARAARRFRDLGVPAFAGPLDRLLLRAGGLLAPRFPRLVMPLVVARLRRESAGVIVPAEPAALGRHLARRREAGFDVNVNVLGEAVLGDAEAARRLDAVLTVARRPDVDHVSVKASALRAQPDVLAFDHEVALIAEPLRQLYRTGVFVNLDMEEYRDLGLTVAAFRTVLDEPEFGGIDAGIVLQAYLPDSLDVLEELAPWAAARRERAGGRIKVRLVKGANLAMERVDAELHGWPQAPFASKEEVDANYKRLLELGLEERWRGALRLGVASHNLFDVAWALTQQDPRIELEMLEGMAEGEARAARARAGALLLYAPVVRSDDFESAIAYLVRRLDENTGPENFLRAAFDLAPGSPAWVEEADRFRTAVADRHAIARGPRRTQDRGREARVFEPGAPFANEPDTDFSLPANRAWVAAHLAASDRPADRDVDADRATVERAVARAREAVVPEDRRALLHRVAGRLAAARGPLLAAMARDAGKTVGEGDPEVSEAVDFANYYAGSIDELDALRADGCRFEPYRVVVVASPWNFPLAIPAGGVLAALAAGAAVILKPAPETVRTARLLAECCWDAGVPDDLLQFVPCAEDEVGRRLITHPDVDAVVLTGAFETAQRFLGWKPELRLHAETSGKNALVVTAAADLDLAVRDLVRSAFGHAGQKCSAASLGILEGPVYDDPRFRRTLEDAVRSLEVGPGWSLPTRVGPLIRPPEGPLAHALTTLEAGESWLVEPVALDPAAHAWRPGVKLGVRPGSMFHLTECFGPVLGLLRAESLDHAIELQNTPDYGLTGGIHSLDPAEVAHWLDRVEVGNAYVNRHTTGAIVQRQPFGGWKRSSVGPTFKAGGPNHVLGLGRWTGPLDRAEASFDHGWRTWFALEHDPSGLVAERNVLRYRPFPRGVLLQVGAGTTEREVEVALAAAATVGTPVVVARDEEAAMPAVDRVRVLGQVGDGFRRRVHAAGVTLDDSPVVGHGRIELLRWVREQAISETRHRYGNPRP